MNRNLKAALICWAAAVLVAYGGWAFAGSMPTAGAEAYSASSSSATGIGTGIGYGGDAKAYGGNAAAWNNVSASFKNYNTFLATDTFKGTNTQSQGITSSINPGQVVAPTQAVYFDQERIPTNINFANMPGFFNAWLQFDLEKGLKQVPNTAMDLFEITQWEYKNIDDTWAMPKGVKVHPNLLGKGDPKDNQTITIVKVRPTLNKIKRSLGGMTVSATDEDVYIADVQQGILAAAKAAGANVIVYSMGNKIKTQQTNKGAQIGAVGTGVERTGSFGLSLPFGISWGKAVGDGVVYPFIACQFLYVE